MKNYRDTLLQITENYPRIITKGAPLPAPVITGNGIRGRYCFFCGIGKHVRYHDACILKGVVKIKPPLLGSLRDDRQRRIVVVTEYGNSISSVSGITGKCRLRDAAMHIQRDKYSRR